jgi:hypothetical protein
LAAQRKVTEKRGKVVLGKESVERHHVKEKRKRKCGPRTAYERPRPGLYQRQGLSFGYFSLAAQRKVTEKRGKFIQGMESKKARNEKTKTRYLSFLFPIK